MTQHINDTGKPMLFKTWAIMVDSMDESDFLWITKFGMTLNVDRPEHTFDIANGTTRKIYGKPSFKVTTTTDKQTDMLMLKYGNCALLLSEEHVLGNTMTCTLDRIVW